MHSLSHWLPFLPVGRGVPCSQGYSGGEGSRLSDYLQCCTEGMAVVLSLAGGLVRTPDLWFAL